MKIDKVLSSIREQQGTKTASVATPPSAAPVKTAAETANPVLVSALNAALESANGTAKTAGEKTVGSPVNDVMKVAQDLAAADAEANIKQAQLMGAAFADAAVARFESWNKVAAEMLADGAKVASAGGVGEAQLKQAELAGYKRAEAEYANGYNDTVVEIHKVAQDEFLKAAAVTQAIIQAAAQK